MDRTDETATLFTIWDTPVKVKPAFLVNVLGLWGLLSWLSGRRHRERPWPVRVLVGALSTLALLAVDVGHAMAHILSARYADAPMDEILLSEGMPRTVYYDNDVAPQVHRMRAVGGPIYSAVGLLASLGLRRQAPRGSIGHEVASWAALGHGLILAGSLAPLPMVDGGTLLKWALVERGQTPEEADEVVKQASLSTGAAAVATGAALATKRRWLPAMGLMGAGLLAIAAALDKIH